MTLNPRMVRFFTLSPIAKPSKYNYFHHQCLAISKGKLVPITKYDAFIGQSRTYAKRKNPKGPKKEEEIEKMKMPGFVHPETHNEEGYFTQQARRQIEELKKRVDKPTIDNKEKKE